MKPGTNYCPGSNQRVPVNLAGRGTCLACERVIAATRIRDGSGMLRQHVRRPAPTVWNRGRV